MTAVSVTTSSTQIAAPSSATMFIHIHNASAQAVYLNYDGGAATVADGMVLAVAGRLELTGQEQCCKGVRGIVAATTADVRVQMG